MKMFRSPSNIIEEDINEIIDLPSYFLNSIDTDAGTDGLPNTFLGIDYRDKNQQSEHRSQDDLSHDGANKKNKWRRNRECANAAQRRYKKRQKEEMRQLKEKVMQLNRESQEKSDTIQQYEQHINDFQEITKFLQSTIELLTKNDDQLSELNRLRVENANLILENGSLSVANANLILENGSLSAANAKLLLENGSLSAANAKLISENNTLVRDKDVLTEQNKHLILTNKCLTAARIALTTENNDIKNKNDRLTQTLETVLKALEREDGSKITPTENPPQSDRRNSASPTLFQSYLPTEKTLDSTLTSRRSKRKRT